MQTEQPVTGAIGARATIADEARGLPLSHVAAPCSGGVLILPAAGRLTLASSACPGGDRDLLARLLDSSFVSHGFGGAAAGAGACTAAVAATYAAFHVFHLITVPPRGVFERRGPATGLVADVTIA